MQKQKVFGTIVLGPIFFSASAQDVKTVINKYFESVGGLEAIASIKTASTRYHSFGFYPKKDTSHSVTKQKLPRHQISLIYDNQGKLDYQLILTEDSMFSLFSKPYIEYGSKRTTKQNVIIDPATELLALNKSKSLKYVKRDSLGKVLCQILKASYPGEQPTKFFYFDNQTGLLLAEKRNDNFTFFKDYRNVSGLNFPFLHEQYLNQLLLSKLVYDTVELNVELDVSTFKIQHAKVSAFRNKESKYNKVEYVDAKYANGSFRDLITAFRGKRILIDIWATWCAPCKAEFAGYDDSFYKFLSDNKVSMLFLSIDKPEIEKTWKKDLVKFNLNGYHLRAEKVLRNSIEQEIGHGELFYIPRYVLIDENGNILSDKLNKPSFPDFRNNLVTLLN